MKFNFVYDIEKLVLPMSFELSEVFSVYPLGCLRKKDYNNPSLVSQRHLDLFLH